MAFKKVTKEKLAKIRLGILALSAALFFIPKTALAVCPVCTVAVAGGLGLARWLKIDDFITGIWVGALLLSMTYWTKNYLKKKNWDFPFSFPVTIFFYYTITFIPLYKYNMIGTTSNQILSMDRLLAGSIIGSILFIFSVAVDYLLRSFNNQKVYIKLQRVIIPFGLLTIASLSIFFLIR